MKTREIWGYSCKCACIYEHMYTYMYKCIRYHIHMRICILAAYVLIQYAVALCSILPSYGQNIPIALFSTAPHSMVQKKCGTSRLNHGDPGGCFFMGMGLPLPAETRPWSWIYSFMHIYAVLYGGCCRCWEDGINTVLPFCDDDASWLSYVFKLVAQPVTSNWLDSQSTVTWPSSITISRPLLKKTPRERIRE